MDVEQMKVFMLEFFDGEIGNIDFSRTPEFYFRRQVLNRLVQDHKFNCDIANDIAGTITVNIPALGFDYEPHQEFLDALAVKVANVAKNMWNQSSCFGHNFTMRLLKSVAITMKD